MAVDYGQMAKQHLGFEGWNADNFGGYQDVLGKANQLQGQGAEYAGLRDYLQGEFNNYIHPQASAYRQGMASQGMNADATDANLYQDQNFQGFVKTGQMPKNASPAQQWGQVQMPAGGLNAPGGAWGQPGSSPQGGPPNLMDELMKRATQGPVDRNDPNIRAQSDAYRANQDRSQRNYLSDLAEKSAGAPVNLQGEQRMAAERSAQNSGAFESELIGREAAGRRDEIMQALSLWGNQITNEQRMGLERELAQLNMQSRDADRAQNNDQFLRELALREWDMGNSWDWRWLQGGI